ncbi:MAG: VWA domain-containing protein [Spirochaetota bacterium]
MWVLERPALLLLLAAVPVLIYLRHVWPNRGGTLSFPFGIWGGKGFVAPPTLMSTLVAISAALFWLGVVVLIVALSGLQQVTRERSYLTRGVDIVVVLDQSPTMAARDFQPENRFEAARSVVRRFVELRENDPIGLVGFGAEASLRVPPTIDYEHLLSVLDEMRILEMGDGTAIGMGLAVAALHLERSDAPRKAIVLLTDGINNAGEIQPETAARAARSLGIEVYVVGIGSGQEVEIEVRDPNSGRLLRGTVRDGFDEEALRAIAAEGGGRYYYAGSNTALQAVFDTIDTVERVEQRSLLRVVRRPFDQLLILIGLVFIMVDFLIRRLVAREVV